MLSKPMGRSGTYSLLGPALRTSASSERVAPSSWEITSCLDILS